MSFVSIKMVRGAKPHRCPSCYADMPVGALHYYCAGKFDGDFNGYRHCLGCHDLGTLLFAEMREPYQLDDLGELARDTFGMDLPEVAAFYARRNWHAAARRGASA